MVIGFIIGWLLGMATLYFRLKNICTTANTHHSEKILGDWYEIKRTFRGDIKFEKLTKCAKVLSKLTGGV